MTDLKQASEADSEPQTLVTTPAATSVNHRFRQLPGSLARMFGASTISSVGDGLLVAGAPLMALTLTHSAILIAGVAAAGRLPNFVLALPLGALADRVDKKRLLISAELLAAAVLAAFVGLVAVGAASIPTLYVTVFVLGAASYTFNLTLAAVCLTVVDPESLPTFNGYRMGAYIIGEEFAGPGAGGLLAAVSTYLPFLGDAVSFVVSLVLVWRIDPPEVTVTSSNSTGWRDLVDGLKWFWGRPLQRTVCLTVACLALCQAAVLAVLVLLATQDMHLSRSEYGYFLAIAAIGQIFGYFWGGKVYHRIGASASIVGAGFVAACCYIGLSYASQVPVADLLLAVEGAVVGVGDSAASSLTQLNTPDEMRGRSLSAFQMAVMGFVPIGSVVGGVLAHATSVRTAMLIAGAAQLIAVLVLAAPVIAVAKRAAHGAPLRRRRAGRG